MNWSERIIDPAELQEYSKEETLARQVEALIEQQKATWPDLAEGYKRLARVETRKANVEQSEIIIQHNPGRIVSTAAAVDKTSIGSRRCFLCSENMPNEERGLAYGEDLVIFCNPFPVLDKHLSIVAREHVEQKIEGQVGSLLSLARDLGEGMFVLYNGPACGASAPDHLHLQGVARKQLMIEADLMRLKGERDRASELFRLTGVGRSVIVLRGRDERAIARNVYALLDELPRDADKGEGKSEPMVNIISTHAAGEWVVYLFPRRRHRPACYFAEEPVRLTVSPGAIDMAGVIVVPDSEHFKRISEADVKQIYREVSLDEEKTRRAVESVIEKNAEDFQ